MNRKQKNKVNPNFNPNTNFQLNKEFSIPTNKNLNANKHSSHKYFSFKGICIEKNEKRESKDNERPSSAPHKNDNKEEEKNKTQFNSMKKLLNHDLNCKKFIFIFLSK